MKIGALFIVSSVLIGNPLYAETSSVSRWFVDGALGISSTEDTTHKTNQTAVGRFSLGATVIANTTWDALVAVGVQNGTTFRLSFPKESIDSLGGVPIEVNIKPFVDVLAGFSIHPNNHVPMNVWLKGGVAYRMMQADRDEVNNVSAYSPELQAGLGYQITKQTRINLGYQVIWGKRSTLDVNVPNETAVLKNIPTQQAVLLGFTYQFN